MRAKTVRESMGIQWSGKDPTKAPIIGKILTRRIEGMEPQIMEVVEIVNDIYIINKWYKPGTPQIVHEDMVGHFIPIESYKDEDLERNF